MVAHEFRSGNRIRLFGEELSRRRVAPFPTGARALFCAYFASAELGCFLELGWPLPEYIIDLFAEFRNRTNGLDTVAGNSLLGAMVHFGLDSISVTEKESMRELATRGEPYSVAERTALLDYCETDVLALKQLLTAMLPQLDLPRATLRGRYTRAVARMEHAGVPLDRVNLSLLRDRWTDIQDRLITEIDREFQVYDERTFKADRFAKYLAAHKIPWPRLESGALALDDDTFKQMTQHYPQLILLRQLRTSLAEMRLSDLAVGPDGRNRALLSPFGSRTGRNQPSNSRFVFGPAVWMRYLIRPEENRGLCYLDWEQQEFGIAAALSEDPAMIEAYQSGDPYLTFAKQAHAVPPLATRITHAAVRELFKTCALGVQYGMEVDSLARRIE